MPGKYPVSLVADDVQASDIIFTTEDGSKIGSIKVADGKFIFDPTESNLGPSNLKEATYGDYMFWNGTAWEMGNTKVKFGRFAGQTGQGENSIAIGYQAGSFNQPNNSIILNATGMGLTGSTGNALFVAPIREEIPEGITQSFATTVTSTQSTNVLSYNNTTNEITYRDLGLVSEKTSNLIPEGSETDTRIISKYSIIPNIDGYEGVSQGLNLGNKDAYWFGVYAKEIHTTGNTIYIADDKGQEMSIKYDPITLGAVFTNGDSTVKSVTTSLSIPGQIDASLLPFTGFNYSGNVNAKDYSKNVSYSFKDQTLFLLYNKRYDVLTSPFTVNYINTSTTKDLFQALSGAYYIVSGIGTGETVPITFSKISASTDLTDFDKSLPGNFTSEFIETEEEVFNLGDSDMVILSSGLEPSKTSPGVIDFVVKWSIVNFRVPINGITTLNIVDFAITTPKLGNSSVTSIKLANGSVVTDKIENSAVTSDKISTNAITLTKLSPDLQSLVVKADGSVSQDVFQVFLTDFNNIKEQNLKQGNVITNLENNINNKVNTSDFNFTTASLNVQLGQKSSSADVNLLKNDLLAELSTKLNNTIFNQTISKLNDTIYNYEKRMYALDQFMKVFSETYTIQDSNNNNYKWSGVPNSGWFSPNFGFTFYGRKDNGIVLNIDAYVQTSLYGKLVVSDHSSNTIKEITSISSQILTIDFVTIVESMFPLKFSWLDSRGNENFNRFIDYTSYMNLSIYTP